jgi:HEAT repeat protein
MARSAVEALGRIGTPKAKAALLEILEKKSEAPGL